MSLYDFLNKIREISLKRDETRQEVQAISRRATRLSKQAIFLAHINRVNEAERLLEEARVNLDRMNDLLRAHADAILASLMEPSLEEYAEAKIFLGLIKEGTFISPEDVGVPGEAYVLGLADVIGELRRRALDLIRGGDIDAAERCLNLMETIYNEIIGCEELQALIPGLRRKCDIARRVIEATRGDVTSEARRTVLDNTMRELQRALEILINREMR